MARTRAAVLDGALRCVEKSGARRTTMNDIAAVGGVAKATLYNHFRTKDDVWAALVETRVRALGEECAAVAAAAGLPAALEHAAAAVREHTALRRIAAEEPVALLRCMAPSAAPGWSAAREAIGATLTAACRRADPAAADAVLRWLASQIAWPAAPEQAAHDARLIAAGLPADARA